MIELSNPKVHKYCYVCGNSKQILVTVLTWKARHLCAGHPTPEASAVIEKKKDRIKSSRILNVTNM
jgi:hypothetical protein